jgi:hypothetical protein
VRLLIAIAAIICTTSCGTTKKGVYVSMDPLNALATEMALVKLNNDAKHDDLITFNSTGNHYIIIVKVDDTAAPYPILGRAWVGGPVCKIEIPERTFTYSNEVFIAVIWHEIGHCYGMGHVGIMDDIMYYASYPISYYSQEAKTRFFGRLYEATH